MNESIHSRFIPYIQEFIPYIQRLISWMACHHPSIYPSIHHDFTNFYFFMQPHVVQWQINYLVPCTLWAQYPVFIKGYVEGNHSKIYLCSLSANKIFEAWGKMNIHFRAALMNCCHTRLKQNAQHWSVFLLVLCQELHCTMSILNKLVQYSAFYYQGNIPTAVAWKCYKITNNYKKMTVFTRWVGTFQRFFN